MILLSSNQIVQGTKVEEIEQWIVVFMTPGGLAETLEEANEFCEKNTFSNFVIKPMVMACGSTLRELAL